MPWYKWNFKTSPSTVTYTGDFYGAINIVNNREYVSKSQHHYNTIKVINTALQFGTSNGNWLTIYSSLSSSKFISYVAAVFYSKDEINSEFFIPLGEAVLNGTYILPKETELSQNTLFVYNCSYKINNAYVRPLMIYVNGDGSIYSLDTVDYYTYTGYAGTSYIGVPAFPSDKSSSDYVLSKTYNSPSGNQTATAKQTLLQNYNSFHNNFNGEFYFDNVNVPQYVADFFNNNTILPNTNITVKYKTNIMGNLKSLYEIKSANFTQSSNKCYLTVTDILGTSTTLTYDYIQHKDEQLIGLSLDGKTVNIPTNQAEATQIQLKGDITLYEVWQTYRPPTTTFDINLYKNSAEPNKVDKTADLSTVGTISGVLRQECSLINPEIIIQYDKPPDFNYCYIANFGRYYYVENIVSMRQNLWRVRLRCDVLMTYKTQILNLNARIARQQYTYSYRQIDSEIPFTNDPEITVQDIPNNLNLGKPHYENILLTVVGNGT